MMLVSRRLVASSLSLLDSAAVAAAAAANRQLQPRRRNFTSLSNAKFEDYLKTQDALGKVSTPDAMADRWLGLLEAQGGVDIGFPLDLKGHGIQTATRALKAGADDETVICALFHDVGELWTPACHGEVAASMLRPYISEKNFWILSHHEIFQAYYYGDAMKIDKNLRDRFRDNAEHFADCEKFCGDWDEKSFDANYENLPLSEFREMLKRILTRKPYEVAKHQLADTMSKTKYDLSLAYTFDEWNEKNNNNNNQLLQQH